ncbi:carbohydrate ABC transporter permease [Treponema phagedenis]|uniref:carbohydrate ABC transporter permease n=1 Tax=Treponema phagedenis TaxID=162 RepID=UPI0001F63BBD|nr:carbohydrate ABC transporter permease [Treponema phagedenis]EFW38275.1 ABC transporter, permease protein [Treponema phagedenis F0421]QSH99049.1 carbohydrate ABC transporter permease [Treponema phagedenis]TYT79360.1 carbohydrate ABC transporter permease [Treponema phagedenis]
MKKKLFTQIVRVFLLTIYFLAAVLPLYWIIVTSLKGSKDIYTFPLEWLPRHITFASYIKLFSFSNFGRYFQNSFLLSLGASFAAMLIAIVSGFALSRLRFNKTKRILELFLYFSQTIPAFIIMVPLFNLFSQYRLIDNLFALGFVYTSTVVAFSTLMARSFFDKVPITLEEASRIDGCTLEQSIIWVVLPLTLPGMAAIFCFAFINIWNELFLAVMLLMSNDNMTIPVALNSFISKAGISWDVMSAGIVIALLPTMVIFGIGQKYIVAGLTEGGIKE